MPTVPSINKAAKAKQEVSQFVNRWMGKTQLATNLAKDAKALVVELNVLEDEVRNARNERVRVAQDIEKLKAEQAERHDSSQQSIDNHHVKLTEARVELAAQKRHVEAMKAEYQRKLINIDRAILTAEQNKDLADAKKAGNAESK